MNKEAKAKDLMEKGWKAREAHEFEESEKLSLEAKALFEELKDWGNVVECLNHLAYLRKIQSFQFGQEAIEFAAEALRFAKEHNVKTALAERANSSVLKYAGEFETAEKFTRSFVVQMTENPAARADMRGDLAFILMRRGKLDEAREEIELAFKELEEGWEEERMPHKMIWKTKLLGYASLIAYNSGDVDKAERLAEEFYQLAKEHNLEMRLHEAESLLELFD